jgi:hypothetical protein
MRAAARPWIVIVLFASSTLAANAQTTISEPATQPVPGGGVNDLSFAASSPAPVVGGVNVSVNLSPTVGFTCTRITIRAIDNATGATLDTFTMANPGGTVNKAFSGLGNNKGIMITVDALFVSGATFDPKHVEAVVTTK